MQRVMFLQLAFGLLLGGGLGALLGYFGRCTTGACPLTANPWRGAFVGAVIGGLFAVSAGSSGPREQIASGVSAAAEPAGGTSETGQGPPLHIDSAEAFERIVQEGDRPVLVDFYADWCGPCRMLAPTIEKLAKDYHGRAIIAKLNVDSLPAIAGRYGIQGIPAVLVFDKGKEVQRLVGLRPQSDYVKALDKLIGQSS
jgi:thioredoxin 1